jgi:hypothetical protein
LRAEHVETWQFTSAQAVEILGWSERQFANWTKRYAPFPHKKQGRGFSITYGLGDLMMLFAAGRLVAAGMSPVNAFALATYLSPLGSMLSSVQLGTRYPGTAVYTFNIKQERWTGTDSRKEPIAIEVRGWPIFDEIWPRAKLTVVSSPGSVSASELRTAIQEFEDKIEGIREERWQTIEKGHPS